MENLFNNLDLNEVNKFNAGCCVEHLDIKITEAGNDYLVATMPVDERTRQPYGVLHGGASCVLAESVGSIASNIILDSSKFYAAGLEINANHVRPVQSGIVTAKATAIHLGKSTHIWDIRITDEKDKLVCISRLTMAVIKK
ncbi:hotdog fold thioesterase [Halobacteriovorax sp. XZX-3]|uniref:hotdog fold thioesterase n=1 Tax=unclassified Halobacteriovorax TaxID=2639665 RepID=UPI000CD1FC74|nr:hotdog fold thioesterase [Halobacteriovorax sp. DA5]POB13324.1 esterase [Halobacteriovorax sp. DA5]